MITQNVGISNDFWNKYTGGNFECADHRWLKTSWKPCGTPTMPLLRKFTGSWFWMPTSERRWSEMYLIGRKGVGTNRRKQEKSLPATWFDTVLQAVMLYCSRKELKTDSPSQWAAARKEGQYERRPETNHRPPGRRRYLPSVRNCPGDAAAVKEALPDLGRAFAYIMGDNYRRPDILFRWLRPAYQQRLFYCFPLSF